jgi:alkylmercury lyase
MTPPADTFAALVRAAAFRRLLRTGAPATPARLAGDLDHPEHELGPVIADMLKQGRLRVDPDGCVVGAAGLSIHPDRHRIELDGRRFWTWCAYDFLGIFAALGATGQASSPSPAGGPPLDVHFSDGRPEPSTLVLFLPDEDVAACCTSVYDQWCPNSNMFRSAEDAMGWANAHGVRGSVLTLPDAAERGAQRWRPLLEGQPQ